MEQADNGSDTLCRNTADILRAYPDSRKLDCRGRKPVYHNAYLDAKVMGTKNTIDDHVSFS